jgi:endo-1,4-beta-mannosidase
MNSLSKDKLDCSRIRGFNYQPGYARSLLTIWLEFDREAWSREVKWSKRFGTNMLRVWLDWHAWIVMGDSFYDALDEALTVLSDNDIKMMPVIFNRWNDLFTPMGMVADRDILLGGYGFEKFQPYVQGLMQRFGSDERIAIWDLCNEPQATSMSHELNFREVVWLARVADWVRQSSCIPITIGAMIYDSVRVYAPLVDIISFHPYTVKYGEMEKMCSEHLAIAAEYNKPLICTEACKGSFDDQERGKQAQNDIEIMNHYGVGWLVWQLVEGSFVTGNKERTDSNSLHPGQGYMPFILKDGTTRPGHEWLELK